MSGARPIFYVHHEYALGGAPLSLLYLLRRLDRRRYLPRVICLREGPAATLYREEKIPVNVVCGPDLSHTELVWFRAWQLPKLLWRLLVSVPLFFRLRRTMRREASGSHPLVHLNSSTLVVAALAAKSLGFPVVWHIREPLARGYLGVRRALLRLAIRTLAARVIAISRHDAAQLGKMPDGLVRVIYNFVDLSQFDVACPTGALRKELNIPKSAPVILFLGGDARVKGADILLVSAPVVLEELRDAHLIFAGEMRSGFALKVSESVSDFLRSRLHVLGPRRDVPSLLADATILVFPSIVPHFARPVIEAAAMAKPVVASDLGGVRELISPGETGILIPPNDPVALGRAILDLVRDPARSYRLGQQALIRAREEFDALRNAADTFEVYSEIEVTLS